MFSLSIYANLTPCDPYTDTCKSSKHNQLRLYNIDLYDIEIQHAMCFHVSRYFELKSTSRVEKIFAHLLFTLS